VIAVSTDKACKPVNVYGMCKAIQERLVIEANLRCTATKFICARYGNVAASRGSVIPLFREQIRKGGPVTVTVKEMTRFLLTMEQAINIIFDALRDGKAGDIYIPHLDSFNVLDLAQIMIGKKDIDIEFTGIRPGEKIHEILISEEEIARTIRRGDYYIIHPILPELCPAKKIKSSLKKELSSADKVINKKELKDFLKKEGFLD
jgi:UDP-glucose 4-epimerase